MSVKDMSSGQLDFSSTRYITQKEHDELYKRCNPEKGDLLVTKVGTTGVPVIVDTDLEFSLFVSVALLKFNQHLIYNKYLYYLVYSPLVAEQAKSNTKGVGNQNWVLDKIAKTLIPIPPLEEQKRIVAKVDELMKVCDELEKQIKKPKLAVKVLEKISESLTSNGAKEQINLKHMVEV